jgi:hypothetical protein
MVNSKPRPLYARERDPVPIVKEAGWAPGPVWTAAENLARIGIMPYDVSYCISQLLEVTTGYVARHTQAEVTVMS